MSIQRIRFVCISDTHGQTPHLPPGDVLIHAGDLCQQGTPDELRKVIKWLEAADFRLKIVVAGNHDRCLDPKSLDSRHERASTEISSQLRSSLWIHYLQHESKIVRLQNEDGTEVRFKVFGSPYTPGKRSRAFAYTPDEAAKLWGKIPLDSDIVVCHTPAKYHLDESEATGAVGCPQLREALWRVRPRLFVCGHIHEGRGAQVVQWDLDSPNVKFKERGLREIPDQSAGFKKAFRVDLSSRCDHPLQNDGAPGTLVPCSPRHRTRGVEVAEDGTRLDNDLATTGQGGVSSGNCADQEALLGREDRQETCIVNASFVPTRTLSRSHRTHLVFNKPITIDLDLPLDGGVDE